MRRLRSFQRGLALLGSGLAILIVARIGAASADELDRALNQASWYFIAGLVGTILAIIGMTFLFMAAVSSDRP